ncbi:MAG: TlpA family protein disulfide reductase [Spirochaetaceae bacterium]|jgi:thiol-disulfide isomerase/thioredoxin|nr:TlpA family protein disulfide reductase [Spirochaetaceae bacterium]
MFTNKKLIIIAFLCIAGCTAAEKQGNISAQEAREPAQTAAAERMQAAFAKARMPLFDKPRRAKDWTLKTLAGNSITLSALKGKIVLVNFWATWCPPCRAEMPSMETFYRHFKDAGLEFAAVDIMESELNVGDFVRKSGYTFPVALDLDGKVSNAYGIQAVPSTFIVNKNGEIIASVVGGRDWDSPEIFAAFEILLNNGN